MTPKVMRLDGEVVIQAAAESAARPTVSIFAYGGGVIRVPGFSRPVMIDLAGLRAPRAVPILLDHDTTQIVGQAQDVVIDGTGVRLSGVVTGDDGPAAKVLLHARNGFVWAASVGVSVDRLENVGDKVVAVVNGREVAGPLFVVRAGRLGEVSLVAVGADETAEAKIAATAAGEDAMESTDVRPEPEKGNSGESATLEATLERARRTRERERRIAEIAGSALASSPDAIDVVEAMSEQAIRAEWSPERFELELLRALRPAGNVGTRASRADADVRGDVLEAALCLAGKLDDVEKHYSPQVLEAAARRWPHGLTLGELLLMSAHRNGYRGLSTSDPAGLLRAAFPDGGRSVKAAGLLSTYDLPGILSNVANKFLTQGFSAVESGWRQISAVRSVRDFKTVTSYALTGGFEYEEVPPGGELKHATISETTYTNKVKTYGRMFAIDRRDIINDDLGALTQVPARIGRGAALKLNAVFWAAFLADSDFFKAANNNYVTGADTALSYGALDRALKTFRKLTDPDGYPIGVIPKILLVPVDLEVLAMTLMQSPQLQYVPATTGQSQTTVGTVNVFGGKFSVVSSSYLSNTKITGYSTTAWYLLADPQDVPVVEVAFLNGRESPTVETAEADFNVLGIQMRGYHDFGVALQEPRGGVKMKGVA